MPKSIELENVPPKYDQEPFFALLDLYFEKNKILIQHHVDSFDQFIDEMIPSIIQKSENIVYEKITETKIVRYRFTFDNLGIKPPSMENDEEFMFPLDAIQKNLSYSSRYTATVTQWQDVVDINSGKKETKIIGTPENDVPIGKIPIMVGSKYCNLTLRPELSRKHCKYDQGGYFIVNGNEKVVLSTEASRLRTPLVSTHKEQNVTTYYIKIQSRPVTQFVGNIQMFTIKIKKDESLVVVIPRFKEISVFTLMRALGLETDEDIVDVIADVNKDKEIVNQLSIAMNAVNTPTMSREEAREEAIRILVANMRSTKNYSKTNPEIEAEQKKEHLMHILSNEILPHVTSNTGNAEIDMLCKACYIGTMIYKLLKCYLKDPKEVEETRGCDDRDSMVNKRIELTGVALANLFEQFFKKTINDCNKNIKSKTLDDNKPPNLIPLLKPNSIEQGLRQALSTGNFGSNSKKGISQMLSRMSHLHAASYLRRIITPTVDASKNKMTSPRHLHNTQYGSMCPFETPEGPKTGIVKNMALLETITINSNTQIPIILKYLNDKLITLDSINYKIMHKYVKVYLNGNWLGLTKNILKIHSDLREMRFNGEIEKTVSLVFDFQKEFHIYTEGGRLIRPYLTVTDNKLNFKPKMLEGITSWDEFMAKYPRVIEYVDKEEEQNIMLAVFPDYIDRAREIMLKPPKKNAKEIDKINRTNRFDNNIYQKYTHCEIHPCMILGLITSNIPFPDHNQSPRGIFQYNQARQAMGLYISDYRERTDISYILYHPQIPLVTSRAAKYTGTHIFPSGENVIVAIASYTGYNQEDSLLMNRSAIDKGLFRAQALKKYFETIKKNPASSKTGIFMKPDKNKVDNLKDANYDKLNEKGYVDVETVIKDGDVIIGMINPKQTENDDEKPYKDNSTIYKSLVPGAIDKVITGHNNDGYPIIKIRVRSERIPTVGDKLACYDDKTEILTGSGWKFFQELQPFDNVATLSHTGCLLYEKPEAIIKSQYSGYMYNVNTPELDLLVTPNHNMWVEKSGSFSLERADCIVGEPRYYQKGINNYEGYDCENISQDTFILPPYHSKKSKKIFIDDWLNFFGLHLMLMKYQYPTSKLKYIFTNIRANDPKHLGQLIIFLEQYHINYVRTGNTKDIHIEIFDEQLDSFIHSSNNIFPNWVWSLSMAKSKILAESILSFLEVYNPQDKITTIFKSFAADLQQLFLHAGFTCDVSYNNKENHYEITILSTDNNSKTSVNLTNKQDSWVKYEGTVYCCTVKSGIVCVRRNGKIVFSGNSRAGQKATIGFKVIRADLPFASSINLDGPKRQCTTGLIPDIIINPNAIPKRMTIGQLIECLVAKNCARKGVYGDATPFVGVDLHKINAEMVAAGYEEWGTEIMYNGMTGKKMDVKIFIGPTYYQRLKQMVSDKAHSRASGPTQMLTRQPTEGRAKDGGLRFGEMERDAICAHGAAQTQKERMVDNSDIYTIHVCDFCGLMAHKVPEKKYYICQTCKNSVKISKINVPYAFKLLMQEFRSINILGRIRTPKSIITPKN